MYSRLSRLAPEGNDKKTSKVLSIKECVEQVKAKDGSYLHSLGGWANIIGFEQKKPFIVTKYQILLG